MNPALYQADSTLQHRRSAQRAVIGVAHRNRLFWDSGICHAYGVKRFIFAFCLILPHLSFVFFLSSLDTCPSRLASTGSLKVLQGGSRYLPRQHDLASVVSCVFGPDAWPALDGSIFMGSPLGVYLQCGTDRMFLTGVYSCSRLASTPVIGFCQVLTVGSRHSRYLCMICNSCRFPPACRFIQQSQFLAVVGNGLVEGTWKGLRDSIDTCSFYQY